MFLQIYIFYTEESIFFLLSNLHVGMSEIFVYLSFNFNTVIPFLYILKLRIKASLINTFLLFELSGLFNEFNEFLIRILCFISLIISIMFWILLFVSCILLSIFYSRLIIFLLVSSMKLILYLQCFLCFLFLLCVYHVFDNHLY